MDCYHFTSQRYCPPRMQACLYLSSTFVLPRLPPGASTTRSLGYKQFSRVRLHPLPRQRRPPSSVHSATDWAFAPGPASTKTFSRCCLALSSIASRLLAVPCQPGFIRSRVLPAHRASSPGPPLFHLDLSSTFVSGRALCPPSSSCSSGSNPAPLRVVIPVHPWFPPSLYSDSWKPAVSVPVSVSPSSPGLFRS